MTAYQLIKALKRCPMQYKVGLIVKRPDGEEFYEFEEADFALSKETKDGDDLPFGIVSLGTFKGDRLDELD